MAFYVRASAFEIPPPSEKDFDIQEDQDEVFPPLKGKKKVINEAINRIFDETWNRIKETGDDEDFETPKGMSFRFLLLKLLLQASALIQTTNFWNSW